MAEPQTTTIFAWKDGKKFQFDVPIAQLHEAEVDLAKGGYSASAPETPFIPPELVQAGKGLLGEAGMAAGGVVQGALGSIPGATTLVKKAVPAITGGAVSPEDMAGLEQKLNASPSAQMTYPLGYAGAMLSKYYPPMMAGSAASKLISPAAKGASLTSQIGKNALVGGLGGAAMAGAGQAGQELAEATGNAGGGGLETANIPLAAPSFKPLPAQPSISEAVPSGSAAPLRRIFDQMLFGGALGAGTAGIGVPMAQKVQSYLRGPSDIALPLQIQEASAGSPRTRVFKGVVPSPSVAARLEGQQGGRLALDQAVQGTEELPGPAPLIGKGAVEPLAALRNSIIETKRAYYASPEGQELVSLEPLAKAAKELVGRGDLPIVNTAPFKKALGEIFEEVKPWEPMRGKGEFYPRPIRQDIREPWESGGEPKKVNANQLETIRDWIDEAAGEAVAKSKTKTVEGYDRLGAAIREARDNFGANEVLGGKTLSEYDSEVSDKISQYTDLLEQAGIPLGAKGATEASIAQQQAISNAVAGYRQTATREAKDAALRELVKLGGGTPEMLTEVAATASWPKLVASRYPWGIRAPNLKDPTSAGPTGMGGLFFALRADPFARAMAMDPTKGRAIPRSPMPLFQMRGGVMGGRIGNIKTKKEER